MPPAASVTGRRVMSAPTMFSIAGFARAKASGASGRFAWARSAVTAASTFGRARLARGRSRPNLPNRQNPLMPSRRKKSRQSAVEPDSGWLSSSMLIQMLQVNCPTLAKQKPVSVQRRRQQFDVFNENLAAAFDNQVEPDQIGLFTCFEEKRRLVRRPVIRTGDDVIQTARERLAQSRKPAPHFQIGTT